MGNIGELVYDAGAWANSGDIEAVKTEVFTPAVIETINTAHTQEEQDAMLAENTKKLEDEQAKGDEFRNDQGRYVNGKYCDPGECQYEPNKKLDKCFDEAFDEVVRATNAFPVTGKSIQGGVAAAKGVYIGGKKFIQIIKDGKKYLLDWKKAKELRNQGKSVSGAIEKVVENTTKKPAVTTSRTGNVSKGKLNSLNSGSKIEYSELTEIQKGIVDDIRRNGDQYGRKTERLTSSILNSGGSKELSGAKYGSNNGFDHVVKSKDGDIVIIYDSKQISSGGSMRLGNNSKAGTQLSDAHIQSVLDNLPDSSPAKQAITEAMDNGTLKKAVIGVDKSTGDVKYVPVNVN